MEDREIIQLLKQRPTDGLRAAMNKYHALVHTVVGRVLPRSPQDAEECVEDTFVRLWRAAGTLDESRETLRGLLLVTARNLAISRWRKLARGQELPLDDEMEPGGDDVAAIVLDAETSGEPQQLVLSLGEPDREIFFRKYFLFESYAQIARRTGLEEAQIRNRLYYGRKKLRRQLEERGYGHEAIG